METLNYINNGHGLASWLLTKDHKRIALLYLASITVFFFSVAVRLHDPARAADAGRRRDDADTYNKMFTMHGVVMVFFFLIPSIPAVLGNFLIPIMIGAKDLAFPRINLLSWYIYVLGGIFTLVAALSGGVDTGPAPDCRDRRQPGRTLLRIEEQVGAAILMQNREGQRERRVRHVGAADVQQPADGSASVITAASAPAFFSSSPSRARLASLFARQFERMRHGAGARRRGLIVPHRIERIARPAPPACRRRAPPQPSDARPRLGVCSQGS